MATTVAVASVVYNMAGDIQKRARYLRSLLTQNIFTPANERRRTMTSQINEGLVHGPGIDLRAFYRWACRPGNYDRYGMPESDIVTVPAPDPVPIRAAIAAATGLGGGVTITLLTSSIGRGDITFWTYRWLLENQPARKNETWREVIAGDGITTEITSSFGGVTTTFTYSAVAPVFNTDRFYAYATYTLSTSPTVERAFIYELYTGYPAVDALLQTSGDYGGFFPSIFLRQNNAFLSPTNWPNYYEDSVNAYKKLTRGGDLEELLDKLRDNANIADIDHAYIVFGVALNTPDNDCRKYIYKMLETLLPTQIGGVTAYADWIARGRTSTPLNELIIRQRKSLSIRFYAPVIEWRFIEPGSGTGLGKVGAKVGELWFEKLGTSSTWSGYEKLRLYWQRTATSHTWMDMVGFKHLNYIYGDNAVSIKSFDAIDDVNESGFLVPLHYDLMRQMSLVTTSQMATGCVYLVLNCVETRKLQWYESGFFQIILVIVVAVVSVVFTGGAGLGLLGANLALGAALGFTGLAAAIVGSVINALAAMILVQMLKPLLEPLGVAAPVAMAILLFAIGQASASLQSTGSMTINWAELLKVDNILAMTQSVTDGIVTQIGKENLELYEQGQDYLENTNAEILKIQQAMFEQFGYGAGTIDPLLLVDAPRAPVAESSSTFLTRTLMTGSEIAEMSRELLYEFPYYSLKLPDAFT